jgi:nucleotide-binding universal stress UspA family protein
MYESILVPLDGSDFGDTALPLAVAMARRSGARLHLVHVRPTFPPLWSALPQYESERAKADRSAREYLAQTADDVSEQLNESVSFELLEGSIAEAIDRYAVAQRISVIVMTTHGRAGMQRAWLGSVADEMIRRVTPPILLIRPSARGRQARPRVPRSVLVPLDGSPQSETILPHALKLAALRDATITLLHVVEPIFVMGDEGMAMTPLHFQTDVTATREKHGQEYLAGVAARLAADGHTVETAVIGEVDAATAILTHAGTIGADVIALSTHARSGWERLAVGSVADKVVRGGRGPVLVFRPEPRPAR